MSGSRALDPRSFEALMQESPWSDDWLDGTELPLRMLPPVESEAASFFENHEDGRLHVGRCSNCSFWVHPPTPWCPRCRQRSVAPSPVSGRATLLSFTVMVHSWFAEQRPYVVAVVELEEQEGLHVTTNIVHCHIRDVAVGMPVEVVLLEQPDGRRLPLFRPPQERGK